MKVSLNWLKELVNIETISVNQLANKLTQAGFEVEDIKSLNIANQIDYILDITSTANRGDALSMIGLAREIAALTNSQILYKMDDPLEKLNYSANTILSNQDLSNCSSYFSAIVDNITITKSPEWLQNRLIASGLNSKELMLDISNYIMLKWGQPITIIDFNKLVNHKNSLKITSHFYSNESQYIKLDNKDIKLNNNILIVKINNNITSIAGIGINNFLNTDHSTKSIFIEAAIFKSGSVRRSSRTLGIRTESSIRQERGLNKDNCENAYTEALSLIKKLTYGQIKQQFYKDKTPDSIVSIDLCYKKIQNILGPIHENEKTKYLNLQKIQKIFRSLNFKIRTKEENILTIDIPSYRKQDVFRDIDVIEEIARVYGYDQFKSSIPKIQFTRKSSQLRKFRDQSRNILRNLGLTELVHYSLTGLEGKINLNNPLIQDYSILRSSLLEGLIKANLYNIKQSNQTIDGFEIGTVFNSINNKIIETTNLAIILGGNLDVRSEWSKPAHPLNWYESKGIIENFFHKLNKIITWKKRKLIDHRTHLINSKRAASLIYNGNNIGLFAELNPAICLKLGLNTKLFILEIDLHMLESSQDEFNYLNYQIKPYSKYPSITRDLSIIIPYNMEMHYLLNLLDQFRDNELENIMIFDQYISQSPGDNHKSIGLRFTYRSNQKTLTSLEVDKKQNQLQEKIIKQLSLKIRQ